MKYQRQNGELMNKKKPSLLRLGFSVYNISASTELM